MPPKSSCGADWRSVVVVYARACRMKDAGLIPISELVVALFFLDIMD